MADYLRWRIGIELLRMRPFANPLTFAGAWKEHIPFRVMEPGGGMRSPSNGSSGSPPRDPRLPLLTTNLDDLFRDEFRSGTPRAARHRARSGWVPMGGASCGIIAAVGFLVWRDVKVR